MSERHWLRNEIDFTDRPHGILGPWEGCGDACVDCNTAAQEIADSLALDGSIVRDDYFSGEYRLQNLNGHARITCGIA